MGIGEERKVVQQTTAPRLQGKVAIITGASRGIGAAAARYFAREGASVVLAARSQGEIDSIAAEIRASGGQAVAARTDVGDPAAVDAMVQQTLASFGRLDLAFNNAGEGNPPVPLAELSVEDFDRSLRVNLRGLFLAMKFEIPAMLAAGGGAIVNMSSTAGLNGVRGLSAYSAGKHGVIGLTRSAALEYAQKNIRINAIAPGPILTERLSAAPEQAREEVARAVPMRRIGFPEEVAAAAAWLCSQEASFITGAVISIDGGRLAGVA